MSATSTKPYFLRALYQWSCDNGYTPYLVVSVDSRTRVPTEYVKDGEIVLNVSPGATRNLVIENDWVFFSARFGGQSRDLSVPVDRITSVFAKETGEGMTFNAIDSEAPPPGSDDTPPPPKGRPQLKVVK